MEHLVTVQAGTRHFCEEAQQFRGAVGLRDAVIANPKFLKLSLISDWLIKAIEFFLF